MAFRLLRFCLILAIVSCGAYGGLCQADTLSFDDLGLTPGDAPGGSEGAAVGSLSLGSVGVDIFNAIFAQEGGVSTGNRDGLYAFAATAGADRGNTGSFAVDGNWFITDLLNTSNGISGNGFAGDPGSDITLEFDAAVAGLSFDIADLNGADNNPEVMTATVYNSADTELQQIILNGGGTAGDGSVINVAFTVGGIRKLVIDVSQQTPPNDYNDAVFAFGIDNISSVVPTPSSFAALIGLGAMGLIAVARRRRKKA